ncbi:armadillo-type protein [Mycena capillaripes]|nr:armadillo-type protein [Mycena capillaripes]
MVVAEATYALSRVARWVDGAQAIFDAKALDNVMLSLDSERLRIRRSTCVLIGNLVPLLFDEDSGVIQYAPYALSHIARWLDGTQAIDDPKTLGHVLGLMSSGSPNIRTWICSLLGNLACYDSTVSAILKPCEQLVSLLGEEDPAIILRATYTLSEIARWWDGTQAILEAKTLEYVPKLLDSRSPKVRIGACLLLGNMARHKCTMTPLLVLKPCEQLRSLLADEDNSGIKWAMYALVHIASWLDGAQAVVEAGVSDQLLSLLESPTPRIRKWTCKLVGRLASHDSTAPVVLELNPSAQLVFLLREPSTRASAIVALCAISERPDGVVALADLNLLEELQGIDQSTDAETQVQLHAMRGNLARYIKEIGIAL